MITVMIMMKMMMVVNTLQILASLGTKVTLAVRRDAVLRNFDQMISEAVTREICLNPNMELRSNFQVRTDDDPNMEFKYVYLSGGSS